MDTTTAAHDIRASAPSSANVDEPAVSAACRLRAAVSADLDAINHCIADAIDSWDLPARVKRLSLPLYRYHDTDLDHLQLIVAETASNGIVGVAAWETTIPPDTPRGHCALLLHGLYVATTHQRSGLGSYLLKSVEKPANSLCRDGILVRAQAGAAGFFARQGYEKLTVTDPERDYPHRYWKRLPATRKHAPASFTNPQARLTSNP